MRNQQGEDKNKLKKTDSYDLVLGGDRFETNEDLQNLFDKHVKVSAAHECSELFFVKIFNYDMI